MVNQSTIWFNIRVIHFPVAPDTNRMFLFNLILFLETSNHLHHPRKFYYLLLSIQCSVYFIKLTLLRTEFLGSRPCQNTHKWQHQQNPSQGFEKCLHVTDSSKQSSTDLLITRHHFRPRFQDSLQTPQEPKLSENIPECPVPLHILQPSPQPQHCYHTLNLSLHFYGSGKSSPSNPENP